MTSNEYPNQNISSTLSDYKKARHTRQDIYYERRKRQIDGLHIFYAAPLGR
jgi:hypothetical protein